jgi:hypothetical protein
MDDEHVKARGPGGKEGEIEGAGLPGVGRGEKGGMGQIRKLSLRVKIKTRGQNSQCHGNKKLGMGHKTQASDLLRPLIGVTFAQETEIVEGSEPSASRSLEEMPSDVRNRLGEAAELLQPFLNPLE